MTRHVLFVLALVISCSGGLAMTTSLADESNVAAQPPATVSRDDTGQTELSDREIGLAIENELLASAAIKSHRMRVTVEGGIVTISGYRMRAAESSLERAAKWSGEELEEGAGVTIETSRRIGSALVNGGDFVADEFGRGLDSLGRGISTFGRRFER